MSLAGYEIIVGSGRQLQSHKRAPDNFRRIECAGIAAQFPIKRHDAMFETTTHRAIIKSTSEGRL